MARTHKVILSPHIKATLCAVPAAELEAAASQCVCSQGLDIYDDFYEIRINNTSTVLPSITITHHCQLPRIANMKDYFQNLLDRPAPQCL